MILLKGSDKMHNAKDVAIYFLNKDNKKKLFKDNLVTKNGHKFYEGNARINKYLFLSQVVYLAKYGQKLINDDFKAYLNGPVIPCIMHNYQKILKEKEYNLPLEVQEFLDKIYFALEDANIDELIDITHEDPEWIRLKEKTYNRPTMNLEKNIKEYQKRYKGLIEALNI